MSFRVQNINVNESVSQTIIQINDELSNITTTQTLFAQGIIDVTVPLTYIINNISSYTITLPNSMKPGQQKTVTVIENSNPLFVVSINYNDGYTGLLVTAQIGNINDTIIFIASTIGWNLLFSSVSILPVINTISLDTYDYSGDLVMVGQVISQGSSLITQMGVVYSDTNHIPTIVSDSIAYYTPITIGVFTQIFNTVGGYYYARAFATNSRGTSYGNVLTANSYICLAHGTMISMYDGTTKPIQDIEYTDTLKVWNFDDACFDSAKPLWIKQEQTANCYNLLEFSKGTLLKTIVQHRIFNKELGKFTHPMTEDTPLGTHTFTDSGEEIELLCKSVIIEEIKYYNVITHRHINMFANGILTSCRYNNIYPIVDMKFIKSDNETVPKPEYDIFDSDPILCKYREGLRLDEQDISLEDSIDYILRREMLKK